MTTGLPPSVQDEVGTEYGPIAATFRVTFPAAPDPPLVLSSTTTMSSPVLLGELGVSGIAPVPVPGASTTKVSVLDSKPSGFSICTERLPAIARSEAVSDVMHCVGEAQDVARAALPTSIVEPGPGSDGEKLLPVTSSVNPPAEPA